MIQQIEFKLQRLQIEYQQLYNQCNMLNNQIQEIQKNLNNLQSSMVLCPTDKSLKASYNNLLQKLRSIQKTLLKNQSKLSSLQRIITVENQKLATHQQKAMMSMYRKSNRGRYPKY